MFRPLRRSRVTMRRSISSARLLDTTICVFWWVTSPLLPQLPYFAFTVWFPHKQRTCSALFHHVRPWSQVYSKGAKRRSSHWRSRLEICPSCRCMSSSHLSVRLKRRSWNKWDLCLYTTRTKVVFFLHICYLCRAEISTHLVLCRFTL